MIWKAVLNWSQSREKCLVNKNWHIRNSPICLSWAIFPYTILYTYPASPLQHLKKISFKISEGETARFPEYYDTIQVPYANNSLLKH